jgi:hypothetical protein
MPPKLGAQGGKIADGGHLRMRRPAASAHTGRIRMFGAWRRASWSYLWTARLGSGRKKEIKKK